MDCLYELEAQELPLRQFTRRFKGFSYLNYWQRLATSKLQSRERRTERYRIIYIWKSIFGNVPSLGLSTRWDSRRGLLIEENRTVGSTAAIRSKKDKTIFKIGPKLFNSLPRSMRDVVSSFDEFKIILDMFLDLIPDCPILKGYYSHNVDNKE